jgi:hypothetical protein
MQPLVKKPSRVSLSRYFLLGAAILLILPLYPFTAISAVLQDLPSFLRPEKPRVGTAPSP